MKTYSFPFRLIIWMTLFALAMGYLESAVVIYLRALLYPDGFAFPLMPFSQSLALIEILREAATMVMLLGTGYMAGRNFITRFAWFIYAFAVWDIFYYVFLKLLLNWPESFLTWDILFLIPTVWVGPVISPIILSLDMVLLAVFIIQFNQGEQTTRLLTMDWVILAIGSLVVIVSFTEEYTRFVLKYYNLSKIWSLPTGKLIKLSQMYVPQRFNWFLFLLGEAFILSGIWRFWYRSRGLIKE